MSDKPEKRPPGPDQKLTFKHWVQYIPLVVLSFITNLLPFFLARAIGRLLGWVFYTCFPKKRAVAMTNLTIAFGAGMSEAEKKTMVRRCMMHYGVAAVEMLCMRRINQRNFLKHVELDNVKPFYDGLEDGKGVILCTAHYGNWEIMNLTLGFLSLPLSAMARPIDNPLVDTYVAKLRGLSGNQVIFKHRSMRRVLKALGENRIVGIVNDQDVHDHNGIFVDFMGRPASTTPTPGALAYKTGAPIVTGYAVPLGGGRYRFSFQSLIRADQDGDKDEEIMRISRLLNARLEAQIEADPTWWMWIHKRFKTTPEGVANPY